MIVQSIGNVSTGDKEPGLLNHKAGHVGCIRYKYAGYVIFGWPYAGHTLIILG